MLKILIYKKYDIEKYFEKMETNFKKN